MLGFRDNLVVNIVDVTLDGDVLGLPRDLATRCRCALSSHTAISSGCLKRLKGDNGTDRRPIFVAHLFVDK